MILIYKKRTLNIVLFYDSENLINGLRANIDSAKAATDNTLVLYEQWLQ